MRDRLSGRVFDLQFVSAGTVDCNQGETIAEVTTDEFLRVLVIKAPRPMRVVEGLQDLVRPTG